MQEAKVPENEAERIAALRGCEILDTIPERAYDDITFLASRLCDTPIALVSLVDTDRQWFKSRVGLDTEETPRALAFCAHAIREPEIVFEVNDASRDERFADNPLVTHLPKIRFYAGAPLVTSEGHALGTLCVIDREPRSLTDLQRESLRTLSRQVVAHLELRRTVKELEITTRSLEKTNQALERRNTQVERSRNELAELCRMLEGQAEVIERDLQRAEVIQRSLLPSEVPRVPDLCVRALYQPGQSVGGDLYDAVGIGGRYAALWIADAAGHGVSAAMLSVSFKQRLRLVDEDAGTPRSPAEVLDELNRSLAAEVSAPGVFVTAAIGLLDTRERRLRLASAGHPPAIVLRDDGSAESFDHTGPALGLYPGAEYGEHDIRLAPGDRLFLFTDGILEASGEDACDPLRLAARLHELRDEKDPLARLLDELPESPGRSDRDDVTMLLVEPRTGESRFQMATPRRSSGSAATADAAPIRYGETPNGTYLALEGRVTWMYASRLLHAALGAIEAGRPLDLDLSACEYLDSTLLGTLHEIVERAEAADVPVRVCAPSEHVLASFEELSLKTVLEHVRDAPEQVPAASAPLPGAAVDPRMQQLRLLKAHEVLADLSEENRAAMAGVVEAMRSELASG